MTIKLPNGVIHYPLRYTKDEGWIIYAEEHGGLFIVRWSQLVK